MSRMVRDECISTLDGVEAMEARRSEALHRVYCYLLSLALDKETAARDTAANQAQAAGDTPGERPGDPEAL